MIKERADFIANPEKTKKLRKDMAHISKKIRLHMRKDRQRYRLEQQKNAY